MLRIFKSGTDEAEQALAAIAARLDVLDSPGDEAGRRRTEALFGEALSPRQVVDKIVSDVRRNGDSALFDYAAKLDGATLSPDNVRVSPQELRQAHDECDPELLASVRRAATNIRSYQVRLLPTDVPLKGRHGLRLGARYVPLRRVGVLVPAGAFPLLSSVLHNAIPAQVAGVEEVALVSPTRADGQIDPALLAAAHEIGVTEYYRIGGAQAVAALAYGTASIPRVDMIVGPGGIFTTLAKRAVYGQAQIDLLAGPSEILIVADESARPEWIAADLLAQAEHDPLASSILVTTSGEVAEKTVRALQQQLQDLPHREAAEKSISTYGVALVAETLPQCFELANRVAPEHLELMLGDPERHLEQIRHAGAVFLGGSTPEPIGDYVAGPSHTLPTGGTARAFSGLGSPAFLRRMSVVDCDPRALQRLAPDTLKMARAEQLAAHARSVEVRLEDKS